MIVKQVILFKSLANSNIQLVSLYLSSHIPSTYLRRSLSKSKAASRSIVPTTNIPLRDYHSLTTTHSFKKQQKRKHHVLLYVKLGPSNFENTLHTFDFIRSNGNKACLHVPPRNWAMIWSFSFYFFWSCDPFHFVLRIVNNNIYK